MGWRLQIVGSEPHQKNDFEFFWGRDGGVPGRRRQSRELGGGGVVGSRAQDVRAEGGVGGRGRASTHGAFSWKELGGGVVRSRAQGGGVVGVRAEGIGVRAWGGGESFDFEFFWGRKGGVPGRWRQRPGMDWPSGLGGIGGRGRASTHGAFSWVENPTKKMILSFFGAGRGGSLVGGDRGGSWGGGREVEGLGGGSGEGVRAGQARTERFRGLTVANRRLTRQKNSNEFFWGREGGVPGRGRQRRELGGGVVRSRAQGGGVVEVMGGGKPPFFEFFWGWWRQRPGMDWPSGLGGVGGRGRASTHEAFSWVGGYKS